MLLRRTTGAGLGQDPRAQGGDAGRAAHPVGMQQDVGAAARQEAERGDKAAAVEIGLDEGFRSDGDAQAACRCQRAELERERSVESLS